MNRALFLALVPFLSLARVPGAYAESPRAAARTIAEQGDARFYEGRCDKAITLWRKADAVFHAPTILLRVARCEAILGRVIAATETLASLAAEAPQAEGPAPAVFAAAREEAKRELPRVRARIATLRVDVHLQGARPAPDGVEIEVDGAPAPAGGDPILIDPGVHRVHVRAGAASWEREVRLEDGEARALDVPLVVEPLPTVPGPQRAAGIATLSTGVAALAIGAGLAGAALSTAHALDGACGADRTQCPPSTQGLIDRVRAYSLAADGSLVGGGVLVVTGAVLLTADLRFGKKDRVRILAAPRGIVVAGEL